MRPLTFFPAVIPGAVSSNWRESNRALSRLIALHWSRLERAVSIAWDVHRLKHPLFAMMDELCRLTCPWCPEPCCISNVVWIDFADLLFLHLTETGIPAAQLTWEPDDTCCYLTPRGCRLPRLLRPWACTLYLCASQTRLLQKEDPQMKCRLDGTIAAIRIHRLDMEDAFVGAVVRA